MKRIDALTGLAPSDRGAAIGLGNFDGVHGGHQGVLSAAREAAERTGALFGAAVFHPHPRRFFQPNTKPFRIMSNETRAHVLAELGVDILYEIPFDRDLSLKDDRGFVRDVLVEALGVAHVAIGFDYHFGRDRVGDAESLTRLGREAGFGVSVLAPVEEDGAKTSSTAIRAALEAGDVATASRLLTRPWIVDGIVERGDQRGRTLGFPTANVGLGVHLRPRYGVYAVETRIEGETAWRPGVANVGVRPHFEGTEERLEVFLFDFSGDLYGRRVETGFRAFLREEARFASLDDLKTQMAADCEAARAALAA